jgi:hypothetical protein
MIGGGYLLGVQHETYRERLIEETREAIIFPDVGRMFSRGYRRLTAKVGVRLVQWGTALQRI